MAPEVISNRGNECLASDIWSCGVLLYAMLTGTLPFKASSFNELQKFIMGGKYKVPPQISAEAQNLLQKILVVNPRDRLTKEEILNHPWLVLSTSYPPRQNTLLNQSISPLNSMLDDFLTHLTSEESLLNEQNFNSYFNRWEDKTKTKTTTEFDLDEFEKKFDDAIVTEIESYGFPREFVTQSLSRSEVNHVHACYQILRLRKKPQPSQSQRDLTLKW